MINDINAIWIRFGIDGQLTFRLWPHPLVNVQRCVWLTSNYHFIQRYVGQLSNRMTLDARQ